MDPPDERYDDYYDRDDYDMPETWTADELMAQIEDIFDEKSRTGLQGEDP